MNNLQSCSRWSNNSQDKQGEERKQTLHKQDVQVDRKDAIRKGIDVVAEQGIATASLSTVGSGPSGHRNSLCSASNRAEKRNDTAIRMIFN